MQIPSQLLANARELRQNQTDAEELLWQLLRGRKLNSLKFRRQHPLKAGFILDFYCAELKLGIELDGGYHNDAMQQEYDAERTKIINEYGINIIRFKNEDVLLDTENVLKMIASSPRPVGHPSPIWRGDGGEEKYFDWHKEFPQVFEKGGFDVVIGNPPYVRLESILDASENLSKQNYQTYDRRGDLYPLFVEKGFSLLRNGGYISYIMPNKWMQAGYGKSLREFFLTKELVQLIDFGDIQIFEGATTYPCIFIARYGKPKFEISVSTLQANNADDFYSNVAQTAEIFNAEQFSSETWVISSQNDNKLLERLKKENITLEKFVNGEAYYGIKTGLTDAFLINQSTKKQIVEEDPKVAEIIKPFLQGRDVKRYVKANESNYLILFEKGFTNGAYNNGACTIVKTETEAWDWITNTFSPISKWLLPFADKGRERTDKGEYWWELRACDYYDKFSKPKIMYQAFQVKPCFIFDEQGLYCNNSMWIIPTDNKALLAILNSKMGWWLISKYCTQIQNGYQLIWKYFGQIPIPENLPVDLEILADKMFSLNSDLQIKRQRFLKRLTDNLGNIKITSALERFDELEFKQFLAELAKQKITLSLKQQDEWEEYFNK
jgi:very-short-patch-repair endonuclease